MLCFNNQNNDHDQHGGCRIFNLCDGSYIDVDCIILFYFILFHVCVMLLFILVLQ